MPYAIEAAFGYCPDGTRQQRWQIVGVNWSPSLINPYRDLGDDDGLDYLLADQRAGEDEPIVLALHIASPRIAYTDKAKSALQLPEEVADAVVNAGQECHQDLGQGAQGRGARRVTQGAPPGTDGAPPQGEADRTSPSRSWKQAYHEVSGRKNLWANARQIMYAARDEIQERSEKSAWGPTISPRRCCRISSTANPDLTADWKVAFDDRGHFADPHTGLMIGLGTVAVREYIEEHARAGDQGGGSRVGARRDLWAARCLRRWLCTSRRRASWPCSTR